jgi:hypothetical protein
MQLSQLQAKKANQDKTLDVQIVRIQNLLAQKQKMLASQTKQASTNPAPQAAAAPAAAAPAAAAPAAGQAQ